MDAGQATLVGEEVELGSANYRYRLEDAVRFRTALFDPAEAASMGTEAELLIGRVLPRGRIGDFGGECLGDTVLFGETAFTVELGYIGTRIESGLGE